jgi:hypothetical protein
MSAEAVVKSTTDVAKTTTRLVDASVRKAWSILEAASEKKSPSEYLSQNAMRAIQGK